MKWLKLMWLSVQANNTQTGKHTYTRTHNQSQVKNLYIIDNREPSYKHTQLKNIRHAPPLAKAQKGHVQFQDS